MAGNHNFGYGYKFPGLTKGPSPLASPRPQPYQGPNLDLFSIGEQPSLSQLPYPVPQAQSAMGVVGMNESSPFDFALDPGQSLTPQQSQTNHDWMQSVASSAGGSGAGASGISQLPHSPSSTPAPVSPAQLISGPMSQGRNPGNIAANMFMQQGYQDQIRERVAPQAAAAADAAMNYHQGLNATDSRFAAGMHSMNRLPQLLAYQQSQAPVAPQAPAGIRIVAPQGDLPAGVSMNSGQAYLNPAEATPDQRFTVPTNSNRLHDLQVETLEGGRAQLVPRPGWQRPVDQDSRDRAAREKLQAHRDKLKQNRLEYYREESGKKRRPGIAAATAPTSPEGQKLKSGFAAPTLNRFDMGQAVPQSAQDVESMNSAAMNSFLEQASTADMSDEELLKVAQTNGITVADIRKSMHANSIPWTAPVSKGIANVAPGFFDLFGPDVAIQNDRYAVLNRLLKLMDK